MSQPLKDLLISSVPWWSLILRAVVAYAAVLILLRLAGKRQVGQMGMAEFVALLLISNAVQNAMNGGDSSLVGGLILATVLILMAYFFSWATYRSRRFESLVQGRPTLLIHHGKILHEHLKRELLTIHELKHLLRRQGIHDLSEIEQAVLESDGFISVTRVTEVPEQQEIPRSDVY
jgi:uncharacterized membrane protein YcaP (DUF421 family)